MKKLLKSFLKNQNRLEDKHMCRVEKIKNRWSHILILQSFQVLGYVCDLRKKNTILIFMYWNVGILCETIFFFFYAWNVEEIRPEMSGHLHLNNSFPQNMWTTASFGNFDATFKLVFRVYKYRNFLIIFSRRIPKATKTNCNFHTSLKCVR